MEKLTLVSAEQPIENAVLYDVYFGTKLVAVHLVANEGFELVKNNEEANGSVAVDIPIAYRDRVNLYKAIDKVEESETPEEVDPETETETQATEEDYINALKELGVNFNE